MNQMYFDTKKVLPHSRLDYWRASVKQAGMLSECYTDTADFVGSLRQISLGSVFIAEFDTSTPHKLVRKRGLAEHCFINLRMPEPASPVTQPINAPATGAHLTIYDPQRHYEIDVSEFAHSLVLGVPRDPLNRYLEHLEAHLFGDKASRLHYNDTLLDVLAAFCLRLLGSCDNFGAGTERGLADVLNGMLLTLLRQAELTIPEGQNGYQWPILERAKDYIEDNLTDLDLNPASIAKFLGMSQGYLHRVFRQENTSIMRYVMERRLMRCEADLVRTDRAVGLIAFDWGFNDASHFARRFAARFGVSPSNYRQAHRRALDDIGAH